jgi:flavin reductase (DIM6/NTAB) family NADH-FMN oxidoreductase RutF
MHFDIAELDPRRSYKLLTATVVPRPIAWVVSADANGTLNAAPFSFFNCFGGHPPLVCIGIGRRGSRPKDTLANIEARGDFVINLVSEDLAEAMNITATDFPAGHDELAAAGLATVPSTHVSVPRIADSPVALECRFQQRFDERLHPHLGQLQARTARLRAVVRDERRRRARRQGRLIRPRPRCAAFHAPGRCATRAEETLGRRRIAATRPPAYPGLHRAEIATTELRR